MTTYDLPGTHPFHDRACWHGSIMSVDNTSTDEFTRNDLKEVVWQQEDDDRWEGEVACICHLKDGRYVVWETSFGPTGDGFSEDAYGGDANIIMCGSLESAQRLGLSPENRKQCLLDLERNQHEDGGCV